MFVKDLIPKKYEKPDMPVGATFVCMKYLGVRIKLISPAEKFDESSKQWVRVEDTGLQLHFQSGRKTVHNKAILKLLMEHTAYVNGTITIDETDPTGFWRQVGAVSTRKVTTTVPNQSKHPALGEIDLNKVKVPEGEPEKIMRVS